MINYLNLCGNNSGNNMLISGLCPRVKLAFAEKSLENASRNNFKVLLLDFQRKSDFSGFLISNGFADHSVYRFESDGYASDMSVYDFRSHARRFFPDGAKITELTALLAFLDSLENKSHSVRELLYKFRNQQQIENFLINQIRSRRISRHEAQDKLQRYLEVIPNGVIADNILDDFDFVISGGKKPVFSVSELDRHSAVIMYMDRNNTTDSNAYLAGQITRDIISYTSRRKCLIIVNTGTYNQAERLYEMTETVSGNGSHILYLSDNIFSGIDKYKTFEFLNLFKYNIFGRTSPPYNSNISELLGERETEKITSVSDSRNHRFFSERLIDRLFMTDYSESSTVSIVKEPVVKPEEIQNMDENSYILYDTGKCESVWGYLR